MVQDWYKSAVIYGVDVCKFIDADGDGTGDFRGLITKLDYFNQLGANCLWLLPFYPSDRKDNGYDITNHKDVDPVLGSLADFRTFVYACKTKGVRVIVDLVMHHTSVFHPWFIASSMPGTSKYTDYYIWREQISPDIQTGNAFPTVEDGVWSYEETAHKYYRHQFYDFEPDLNLANKEVQHEIYNIVDFWLAMGVDGFRVDAAAFVLNQKGMLSPDETTAEFFEALRAHISQLNPEAVLIGEADVAYNEIPDYFGSKTKLQMLNNFLLNSQFFLSLATSEAKPLAGALDEQQAIKASGTWVNFVRNLDELNLMHLSKEDQQRVMDTFAPEPNMTIYDRGIRRRFAPMVNNNLRQLKMAYSLMFSLPGVPLFMYGDEIGMGDDLAENGRDSVRLPMQWDDGHNGGFSSAETVLVNQDELYGAAAVNVKSQTGKDSSLLTHFQRLIALRKQYTALITDGYEVLDVGNPHVLAIRYQHDGQELAVLHNLSESIQKIKKPAGLRLLKKGLVCGDGMAGNALPGYGWGWYATTTSDATS